MNPIKDHMSENFVGICKATCQRCDINLTRIHLLLEVLEHSSNLSGLSFCLKRMTSGFIHWGCWFYPLGSRLESYYQRFNVNMIG